MRHKMSLVSEVFCVLSVLRSVYKKTLSLLLQSPGLCFMCTSVTQLQWEVGCLEFGGLSS